MAISKPCLVLLSANCQLLERMYGCKLELLHAESMQKLQSLAKSHRVEMIVLEANANSIKDHLVQQVSALSKAFRQCFICVYGEDLGRDPHVRIAVGQNGGAMSTWDLQSVMEVASRVHATVEPIRNGTPAYECPFCGKPQLSENALWFHCPLYHANEGKLFAECPICRESALPHFARHLYNCHGPATHGEVTLDINEVVCVRASAAVVVQRADKKLLLVQENRSVGFYLPGGTVDPGEDLCTAARREVLEETGIEVELKGILQMDFIPLQSKKGPDHRLRCIFYGVPVNPKDEPKSIPDYESVGATWVGRDDLEAGLHLKKSQIWRKYLDEEKPVYPLSILNCVQSH